LSYKVTSLSTNRVFNFSLSFHARTIPSCIRNKY
jgi:hypothetical protein